VCVEDDVTGGDGGAGGEDADGEAGEGGEAPTTDDDGGETPGVAGASGGGEAPSTGGVDATGGTTETGGTDTGGTVATGGTETGGAETGGTVPTGGTATGGVPTGGTGTGGTGTGGTGTGGTGTGGTGTGGTGGEEPDCYSIDLTNGTAPERTNAAMCWAAGAPGLACSLSADGTLTYCETAELWYQVEWTDVDGVTFGDVYQAPLSEDTGTRVGLIYQSGDGSFRIDTPDGLTELGFCTVVGDILTNCMW